MTRPVALDSTWKQDRRGPGQPLGRLEMNLGIPMGAMNVDLRLQSARFHFSPQLSSSNLEGVFAAIIKLPV